MPRRPRKWTDLGATARSLPPDQKDAPTSDPLYFEAADRPIARSNRDQLPEVARRRGPATWDTRIGVHARPPSRVCHGVALLVALSCLFGHHARTPPRGAGNGDGHSFATTAATRSPGSNLGYRER